MDQYVTGAIIKEYRENSKLTQLELAQKLGVSDKTISKWETGRGYPDITILETLGKALGLSVSELMLGKSITNTNKSANIKRIKLYVCPICGNVITSVGEAVVTCCGIVLPNILPEETDKNHALNIESVEDEFYCYLTHPMQKDHYISFIIAVKDDGFEIKKLYPEGPAQALFKKNRTEYIYYYCNKHGLFKIKASM